MARKLIIDLDPGIGDALAAILALIDPEIEVVALTATGGCVSGAQATRNLLTIIGHVDAPRWPRIGTAPEDPQLREVPVPSSYVNMEFINGPTGFGDVELQVAELHNRRDSVKVLVDTVKAYAHEVSLLTLGPLTNVAAALEHDPEFLTNLESLVCMAGTVSSPGDVTAAAEFNVFHNPVAARTVLSSIDPKVLIPLDVSQSVVLTFDAFNRLMDSVPACGRFLQKLLPYYFRSHHQFLGIEGILLREVAALAAITQPQLFRTERMAVEVETQGELTRGMTVCDRRRFREGLTNANVAVEVDAQGVLDYLARTLKSQ